MIDAVNVRELLEPRIAGTDLFIVEVKVSASNDIEVVLDSDSSVGIDTLAEQSRFLEQALDRDREDFQLTLSSAGIGQPLKLLRQYRKLTGQPLEVVLFDGTKLLATLNEATEEALTLEYPQKVSIEGKKHKETQTVIRTLPMGEIKSASEYLTFK